MKVRSLLLALCAGSAMQAAEALDARCPQLPEDPAAEVPTDPPWVLLDWPRLIEGCVPHLQHDRGKRWPLMIWDVRSGDPFTEKAANVPARTRDRRADPSRPGRDPGRPAGAEGGRAGDYRTFVSGI